MLKQTRLLRRRERIHEGVLMRQGKPTAGGCLKDTAMFLIKLLYLSPPIAM